MLVVSALMSALIDSLDDRSIKHYLSEKKESISEKLKKETGIGCERDLKNYTCVYRHGETLRKLLGEREYSNLLEAVNKKKRSNLYI